MISVAMATYNGAKYIQEQLDSILGQTIQDFEIVICDDCSSDDTWRILEEYALKDKRIRLFRNDKNLGFKRNFEKTITLCKGDYIALCDQDDIWRIDHLEILLYNIGDNMLSGGNSEIIEKNGNKAVLTLKKLEAFDHIPNSDMGKALSFLLFRNPIQGAAMLIRRDFFSRALPIPEGVKYHDAWFAAFSCFYGGLNYTEKIVNSYRMHSSNVTGHRIKPKSRVRYFIRGVRRHLLLDRESMVIAIEERTERLTDIQQKTLKECKLFIIRDKTKRGRLLNIFYKLSHFKTIYCC